MSLSPRRRTRPLSRYAAIAGGLAIGLGGLTLWAQQYTRDRAEPRKPVRRKAGDPLEHAVEDRSTSGRKSQRLREGTELRDVPGTFVAVKDRFEFVTSDGVHRLRMLENLALERVVRKVGEGADKSVWKVSGMVTEFEGTNYFLVRRIIAETPTTPAQ
jgi:hypothetical protein